MSDRPITPVDVEVKLHSHSETLDEVYSELKDAEYQYYTTKAAMEIGMATAFLEIDLSKKVTVAEKDALVREQCADLIRDHAIANALVNAARKNFERIKVQIEITRSQSSIIRTSLEMA
jgi:hypothetical protein